MQNLYQLVKYCLINIRKWIHVMSDITLHVNMTPLGGSEAGQKYLA